MARITVPMVLRDLGLEASPGEVTAIGAIVRHMWLMEHGELPRKELMPKTNGGGTHCFATYPESWRPKIVEVIQRFGLAKSDQLELFP